MSYTREYLLNLPAETRKGLLKQTIQPFIQNLILPAARSGKTSISFASSYDPSGIQRQNYSNIGQNPPTTEEICQALLEELPDCKITYEEKWVETSPGKKELKKGIEVDWS